MSFPGYPSEPISRSLGPADIHSIPVDQFGQQGRIQSLQQEVERLKQLVDAACPFCGQRRAHGPSGQPHLGEVKFSIPYKRRLSTDSMHSSGDLPMKRPATADPAPHSYTRPRPTRPRPSSRWSEAEVCKYYQLVLEHCCLPKKHTQTPYRPVAAHFNKVHQHFADTRSYSKVKAKFNNDSHRLYSMQSRRDFIGDTLMIIVSEVLKCMCFKLYDHSQAWTRYCHAIAMDPASAHYLVPRTSVEGWSQALSNTLLRLGGRAQDGQLTTKAVMLMMASDVYGDPSCNFSALQETPHEENSDASSALDSGMGSLSRSPARPPAGRMAAIPAITLNSAGSTPVDSLAVSLPAPPRATAPNSMGSIPYMADFGGPPGDFGGPPSLPGLPSLPGIPLPIPELGAPGGNWGESGGFFDAR
eukprot:gnl/Dysnectes_brevis/3183_a3975_625.p1 GENE.gnl/Dysnectes_brevis/3183_a3975_625~~gnl/Dysnectes_brevis/3183_a3975_625.p1  ORF type:complete len:414 (+),score=120.19 gnl/Dysnectes_brevis/3183_a3975_625:83-1324(+)